MRPFKASLLIILLLASAGCTKSTSESDVVDPSQTEVQKPMMRIDALYNDGSSSFDEMNDKSSVAGVFRVVKVKQVSEFAVAATVQTIKIWKGKAAFQIFIPQIGQVEDSEVLDEGKSYVLFLASDAPGKMHIVGGFDGLFPVKDSMAYTHRWSSEIGSSIGLEEFETKIRSME